MSDPLHKCFGCGKEIKDFEPHIHVSLDDFATDKGLDPLGLDDVLGDFAFCEECTQRGGRYQLESHGSEE